MRAGWSRPPRVVHRHPPTSCAARPPCQGAAARRRGFTLLEVLVALTIIAVALSAAMRGAIALTGNAHEVDRRVYATLIAQNQLAELRLAQGQGAPTDSEFDCEQGGVVFHCRQKIVTTPNPFFRWVEIHVSDGDDPARDLAELMALLKVY